MATEIKVHVLKAKPNQDGSSKVKGLSPLNKKKVVSSSKHTPDSKQKSVSTLTKSEVKAKTTSTTSSSSKSVSKTTAVKREPLRIFYESLSKQIPSSEMAEFWMMEHGLLSPERAKKAYERKQRRQQQLRMGTPIKSLKLDKPESSQKQKHASKNSDLKTKKRIINENDDDDFIVRPKKIVKS
ncbi:PREDICTED: uncharacterized protein LOC104592097 isoform X3 [Nelumbo nucifera]|uniref:Uncharacterized protein n=2 Tax=Nelumbo nucifera TaxID=4432 RepID=A0A822YW80_NELNU|nr:PREDICTED: uncharacterized protein LOC104592097 isoform X3 [Nelumbo nucifera]DAD35619.1 TPA_asm: hypothetical protein HUJ06_006259 [Nelumbo nucifera]